MSRLRDKINSKRIEFQKFGGVKIESSFEDYQYEILVQNLNLHIVTDGSV